MSVGVLGYNRMGVLRMVIQDVEVVDRYLRLKKDNPLLGPPKLHWSSRPTTQQSLQAEEYIPRKSGGLAYQ